MKDHVQKKAQKALSVMHDSIAEIWRLWIVSDLDFYPAQKYIEKLSLSSDSLMIRPGDPKR